MRSVELFAGGGGLALGISRAGFAHETVVELEKNACNTLRQNKLRGVAHVAQWPIHEADVSTFALGHIASDVDLLAGGVPCQPFSCAGKGQGQDDKRNMFPALTRAVRALTPKAIVIENVKGLARPGFEPYLKYVMDELRFPELARRSDEDWRSHHARLARHASAKRRGALEYDVHFHLVNAADFGVPQWRERVFLIAFRRDLEIEWSFPSATHSVEALLWSQYHEADYWERHGLKRRRAAAMTSRMRSRLAVVREMKEPPKDGRLPWQTVRDALAGLPPVRLGQVAPDDPNHFLNPGARTYTRHTGSPLDEPSKTIKAGSHGVPGGENTVLLDDGRTRYFSVRECARIQTFPDDWRFEGVWSRAMRQVGNAVPVTLAMVVAQAVRRALRVDAATRGTSFRALAAAGA